MGVATTTSSDLRGTRGGVAALLATLGVCLRGVGAEVCGDRSGLVVSNPGFKLGDALVRYRESVFQADDALRGVQGQALIEQCSHSGGEFELAA